MKDKAKSEIGFFGRYLLTKIKDYIRSRGRAAFEQLLETALTKV